jgi:DNA-binding response OmpR family regulator
MAWTLERFARVRDVPVIVTTAHPLDEVDRVLVFELGADDYLLEPFVLRELLARLKAILRRQETGRLMLKRAP